ncbi:MAG: hypothetical protein JEZ05_10230 [Tenericutes bacterium]|nr:hypothetical protein [Mycoplasmatota bacterium]
MVGVEEGSITTLKEHYLYPFLGNEALKTMFDKLVKDAHENTRDDNDKDEVDEVEDELDE